jgi:hypothetical protein
MGTQDVTQKENTIIDFSTINNISDYTLTYHDDEDTLFIRPDVPRPATSFDWNGEIWIRVDPTTGEVLGLEIDDFEAVFLKRHPEISVAWDSVKPTCLRKLPRKSQDTAWDSFTKIVLSFLLKFFNESHYQSSFNPA